MASVFVFYFKPLTISNLPLLTVVFPSWFQALFAMQWQFPPSFFTDIGIEIVSLGFHALVGILFLRLFVRLPAEVEWIAGIFLGIGLATFVLEFWAMAFLLNRWTVLLSLVGLILLLVLIKRWQQVKPAFYEPEIEILAHPWDKGLFWCAWCLLAAIIALSFYHALLYPVDYWDALILYTHYGKITYQQGGFPILVCLQVGLGLGANYPHLFPLHQAITASLFHHWSDLYGQLIPPLAGLGSCLVLYALALRLFRNRVIAIFSILVFRSVPFVTSYFVWVSDYSLVMLYTTLFLYFLERFLSSPHFRSLMPLVAVSAIVPHINYLGWIVWPILVVAVWYRFRIFENAVSHSWIKLAACFCLWLILGLTWYVRNWIVTGNPVYAFFPTLFGGININLDVLESCNLEWLAHGDGAKELGSTLLQRMQGSFYVFQRDWRFAPFLTGIMLPAFLLGWKKKQPFFVFSGLLLGLYFVYQYIISGLYWYHTIAVFPILGLFAGRFLSRIESRVVLHFMGMILLCIALVPGLSVAIMGPKVPLPTLPLFPYPGMSPEDFYQAKYHLGFDEYLAAPAWKYINQNVERGAMILTHDNRYHVYRDDIQIIHLDDCALSPLYGTPYPEIHQILLQKGVRYYLYFPDEQSHPINAQLGHRLFRNNPKFFKALFRVGSGSKQVVLYRLVELE